MAAELQTTTVEAVKDQNGAENIHSETIHALVHAAEHFYSHSSDGHLFLVAAQQCLEEGNFLALLECLQDIKHRRLLDFVGWDLMKVVFPFLPDSNIESSDCEKILLLICETCNPREICLSLGELLSRPALTWQRLVTILRLLQQTCKRLKGKVAKVFSSVLWSLGRCFRSKDNIFDHLVEILEMTLELLRPLIEEHLRDPNSGNVTSEDCQEVKQEMQSFLVNLLEYPLVLLEVSGKSENEEHGFNHESCDELCRFRKIVETVVEFLGCVECNSFRFLFEYGRYRDKQKGKSLSLADTEECDEIALPSVGLGYLAFLVHVENIGARFNALIFSGQYHLETLAVHMNSMLSSDRRKVISKGVWLLLAVLSMVDSETLEHHLLENNEFIKLAGILTNLMTHNEDASIRKHSVQGLRELISIFKPRGRYKLLRLLHQSCSHSGLAELLTLILKDEILKSLSSFVYDEWFVGQSLESFLQEVFRVPSQVFQSEDGIVKERNRILSALNLCRFLLIRDKENKTRIYNMLPELEKIYLKPLTDAIALSKAKLKGLVQEKEDEISGAVSLRKQALEDEFFNVATPDGEEIKKSSSKDQLELLQSAILAVDMIESVLERINEICSDKNTGEMKSK